MKTCSPAHHFHRLPARWRVVSRWLLLAFCVALLPQLALPTHAQTDATTASAALEGRIADPLMPTKKRSNMLAVGAANVLDTYLSAEKYNGTDVRYISTLTKPTRWSNIHQTFLNEGLFVVANNRADNNDELGGMYRFQYRLHRNWQVASGLELEAGAAAGIQVGFLYNTRNSNNPAQAYASLQLMPSAAATQQVTLLRRKAYVSYEISVPLVGLMFSPNYGQSYYEIFSRGNYDHNVVPTTIASTPSLRHMLTLDFPLSRRKPHSMLRIGYLGDYQQASINNLKQHHYSHLLVLGWTRRF